MSLRIIVSFLCTLACTGAMWAGEPFAVVELFTSEGCSSCPPADRVLSEFVAESESTGRPVYCLAFHVDYWNRLGWTDRFASPEHSERQRRYAEAFGEGRVYTPQAVVNGSKEMVGSNRPQLVEAVAEALRSTPAAELEMVVKDHIDDRKLEVEVKLRGLPPGVVLNLALVERALATRVERGENAGRTLRHDNVVRHFTSYPVSGDAMTAGVFIPRQVDLSNASLIAYLQDPISMRVLAADEWSGGRQ